ncbi:MAG: carbohydrate ABC transporter permease [Christensenellales bacterium]|jgi:multiple sugar transport system permease protein
MGTDNKRNAAVVRILCTVGLSLIAVFWLLPIVWIITNSFKTNIEFSTSYANIHTRMDYIRAALPEKLNLGTYVSLFTGEGMSTKTGIVKMISNSLIISVIRTVVVTLTCSMAAFAYERLEFPGGDTIFWGIFFISLIPSSASTLPLFKICNSFGWVNNIHALIWPGCVSIMSTYLMRNFLVGIPKELDEAARIDGASSFQIFLHVISPSIKPVLMIVALNAFRGGWNDYYWPSIVMTDPKNQTLTSGLSLLQSALGTSQFASLLASTVVSMVVPLLLYLFSQKYFLEGIKIQAAVKG